MVAYEAPGVYYQTVDAGAPEVTPLRTDIVGFVGIAARGPIDMPVPVQSWRQFASWFGSFTAYAYLAYAVRGFGMTRGTALSALGMLAGDDLEWRDGELASAARSVGAGSWEFPDPIGRQRRAFSLERRKRPGA